MPLLNGRNLDGREVAEFSEALRDAFRTPLQLEMMLGQGIMKIAMWDYCPWGTEYDVAVHNLILNLQAKGKTAELLTNARLAKPGNVKLFDFASVFGLTSLHSEANHLERIVKPKLKFMDVQIFIQRLAEVEGRVCRVDVETDSGTVQGTGFLVGKDTVLTNYHVIKSAAKKAETQGAKAGQAVTVQFDYKVMSNGQKVFDGTKYELVDEANWLADWSPYSVVDGQPDPKSTDPDPAELDYAVLRLAKKAANDPVGALSSPGRVEANEGLSPWASEVQTPTSARPHPS